MVTASIRIDAGRVMLWSGDRPDERFFAKALDNRWCAHGAGVFGPLAVLPSGVQWATAAALTVELVRHEPTLDPGWEDVVDLDLDVRGGVLRFEAPHRDPVEVPVPDGSYRGRWSGRNYAAVLFEHRENADEYRLQLWPRAGKPSGTAVVHVRH